LQDGVPLDRVECVRHVDGEDDPVGVIAAGVNEPLQAHADHLGGAPHRNSTLAWLQGSHLIFHLVQSQ
jgi:hypothetical protein